MLHLPPRRSLLTPREGTGFLARTSGLRGEYQNDYLDLFAKLKYYNLLSKLDVLQIRATQDSATGLLNLISPNFNGIAHGSPTFAADHGFTGSDSSSSIYIDSAFNASVGSFNYTRDSAHLSMWTVTNVASNPPSVGLFDSGGAISQYVYSKYAGDGNAYFRINVAAAAGQSVANSNAIGHYIGVRENSTTIKGYKNGIKILTATAQPSIPLANLNFFTIGGNSGGSAQGSGQQEAMFSAGAALSEDDAFNFFTYCINPWMTKRGIGL